MAPEIVGPTMWLLWSIKVIWYTGQIHPANLKFHQNIRGMQAYVVVVRPANRL
jgi:hypothetical protein